MTEKITEKAIGPVSRRSMLVATGGIVAAGLVTKPTFALSGNGSREIKTWTQLLGQEFDCSPIETKTNRNSSEQPSRMVLRLIGVDEYQAKDPDRPQEFRKPFSLAFQVASSRGNVHAAQYVVSNSRAGECTLLLNEAMDMQSGEMVVEAVFS